MGLRKIARRARRGVALVSLGLASGAVVLTARHALMTPQPLKSGLPGEGRLDRKHGGDVFYAVAGPADGRPVVLLHDFYPGASNYEFRAIYNRLAETYRVYAPDWLGFGMSERPPLTLTGEFYAAMLVGFLRDVVGTPAVVVARGRAANIATRAAADVPALFDRLALVGPDLEAGERLDPTAGQVVARLFQRVSLGLTPYAALSLRPALRLAEGLRSAVGPGQVDSETVDHLYASAHQFGGQHGTLALLTGELDLPIQQVFPTLEPPALLVIGERDRKLPVSRLERLVALNPHADLEVILSAGAAVYQDQPKLFTGALHRWLGRRIARQTAHVEARTVAERAEAARVAERVGAPAKAPVALEPSPAPVAAAPRPALMPEAELAVVGDIEPAMAEPELAVVGDIEPVTEPELVVGKDVEPVMAESELAVVGNVEPETPEAPVEPVKIVPVLDVTPAQAAEPRLQTRTAPLRERKTTPHVAPKAGRRPTSSSPSSRKNGNSGGASSNRTSSHKRKRS